VRTLDGWLAGLLAEAVAGTPPPRRRRGAPPPRTGTDGLALVAVGSLGRREPAPYTDLDLVLVHDGRPEIAALADALWYPIWDAGVRLDHSVRSITEAVSVASTDTKAVVGSTLWAHHSPFVTTLSLGRRSRKVSTYSRVKYHDFSRSPRRSSLRSRSSSSFRDTICPFTE